MLLKYFSGHDVFDRPLIYCIELRERKWNIQTQVNSNSYVLHAIVRFDTILVRKFNWKITKDCKPFKILMKCPKYYLSFCCRAAWKFLRDTWRIEIRSFSKIKLQFDFYFWWHHPTDVRFRPKLMKLTK